MRLALLFCLSIFFVLPVTYAQWQPMESPSGAEIRELVQSGSRVFAPTWSGLYYSDDGGDQWHNAFSGEFSRGFVSSIQAVDDIVFCRIRSTETGDYKILTSANNGEDWNDFSTPFVTNSSSRFFFNGEVLVFPIQNVIFVSYDLGENWETKNQGNLPFLPFILIQSGDIFFHLDNDFNLWRADNMFENWTMMSIDLLESGVPSVYVNGDNIVVGLSQNPVQYSTDGGETWNSSTDIPSWYAENDGFWYANDQLYTIYNGGVHVSEDFGATWTRLSPFNTRYTDMVFLDGQMLLSADEAIYQSSDLSQTVQRSMQGMEGITVDDFDYLGDQFIYYTDRGLNLVEANGDQMAITETGVSGIPLDEMESGDGYYYINELRITGPNKHVLSRIDSEGNFTQIHSSDDGSWLASDHMKFTDNRLFYFDFGPPIYSTDNGDNWQAGTDFSDNGENFFDIVRHEDALFVASFNGIKRLVDGQSNWELVTNGLDMENYPSGAIVRGIRLYSTPGALFLALPEDDSDFLKFYVSNDNGDNWQQVAEEFAEVTTPYSNSPQGVKNIVALGGYHVMALRDVGIIVSSDMGLNWTVYNDGLPTDVINQIKIKDGRLIAATQRHGLWSLGEEDIRLQNIEGRIYFDEDNNGQFNVGELLIPNVKLLLEDNSDLAFTNEDGLYRLSFVNDGNFAPQIDNPYITVNPEQRNTADLGSLDFGLQLDASQSDFCVSLHADQVHRPGFSTRYYLKYQNLANTVSSASLVLDYFEFLEFQTANQTPSDHQGNQLSFELGELAPLASGTIIVDFKTAIAAPLGSDVLSTLTATIPESDANGDNNIAKLEDIVVGSYDPNDIQVSLSQINPGQVADQKELAYRIRFQNTGNYPADRVVVRNKIDRGLNLSSIREITTSHDLSIERTADRELAFVFNDINLADSTSNEPESHGFITYRIKVDPSLMLGDTIYNQAAIFFDFNPPIITNIATTSVDNITSSSIINIRQPSLVAFPNPAAVGTDLQFKPINTEPGTLYVYDVMGRRIQTIVDFDPNQHQMSTANLAKGQYWLIFETQSGWLQGQIIIQ